MIHILLMILKVIGVILLVILGLILAAVLLILFVPVRYRVDVSFEGKPDGEAAVSWLLHLVRDPGELSRTRGCIRAGAVV